MAHSLDLISSNFIIPCVTTWKLSGRFGNTQKSMHRFLGVRAVQETGRPRRLVDIVRDVSYLSQSYFKSPFRRALFGGISLLGGFFVAQTISLSFGALGVNDVIAAVLCVLLSEYVTKVYYSRSKDVEIVTAPLTNIIASGMKWSCRLNYVGSSRGSRSNTPGASDFW